MHIHASKNLVMDNLLNLAFANTLVFLRKQVMLSQQMLAIKSGLNRSFISLLEKGTRQPSLQTILDLAHGLDMEASEMVEW